MWSKKSTPDLPSDKNPAPGPGDVETTGSCCVIASPTGNNDIPDAPFLRQCRPQFSGLLAAFYKAGHMIFRQSGGI